MLMQGQSAVAIVSFATGAIEMANMIESRPRVTYVNISSTLQKALSLRLMHIMQQTACSGSRLLNILEKQHHQDIFKDRNLRFRPLSM